MISTNFEWAIRIDHILNKHLEVDSKRSILIRDELLEHLNQEMVEWGDKCIAWSRLEGCGWEEAVEQMGARLTKQIYRASLILLLLLSMAVIGLVLAG